MRTFNYKSYSFISDIGTMTPIQYIKMIDTLEEFLPKNICELGSGISTQILDTFCINNGSKRLSVEHDDQYNIYQSTILLPLIENVDFSVNNHIYKNCSIYDGLEEIIGRQEKFDFVLIDGANDGLPINFLGLKYARVQILDFVLLDKLSDKSIVMYHDSNKDIAQNTLSEFEKLLSENGFKYDKEIVLEKDDSIIQYNKQYLGFCPELTIYKLWK